MKKFPSAFDVQEGGDHYKKFKIQPNLFITENELDFNQANVVKLICRHKDKNGIGDIKKIIHYARIILEQEYGLKSDIQYDEPTKITAPKRLRRVRRKTGPSLPGVSGVNPTDDLKTRNDLSTKAQGTT